MTIDDKIRNEKLQSDISRAAVKISVLPSRNKDKFKNLKGYEGQPSWEHRITQEAKFSCSPHRNRKKTNAVEKHSEKQVEALQSTDIIGKIELNQFEDTFPQNLFIGKLKEIAQIQDSIKLNNLNYSTSGSIIKKFIW